jgi:Rad3-related DNA helicase
MGYAAQIEAAKNELSHYRNEKWREYQVDAISYILSSTKKFVFLSSPTGSGKSLLAMISGLCMGGVTYAVHSKILQNQVVKDFPEARSLYGRANYPCLEKSGLNCAECFSTTSMPCKSKNGSCVYELEKKKVIGSRLRILNFSYLLSEVNYVGRFSNSKFNIIDEADSLESVLIDFTTLTFTSYALNRLGLGDRIDELKKTSKYSDRLIASWKEFVQEAKERLSNIINILDKKIAAFPQSLSPDEEKIIKDRTREFRLLEKINLFLDNVDDTWVYDDTQEDKYIFRPLWMTEDLADKFLWRHAEKWILLSATFMPLTIECKRLGIPNDEAEYKEIPSTFPVKNRPIYFRNAVSMSHKTAKEEIPKLAEDIRKVMDQHKEERGVIHCVSYSLGRQLASLLDDPRIIFHDSLNRQEKIDLFVNSEEPFVLLSPSVERGLSLEEDKARWCYIAKAPYLSLLDDITRKRVYSGKMGQLWYTCSMLLTTLQMTGRIVRSKNDFGVSYIGDEQVSVALNKHASALPSWWREAIMW